MNKVTTDISFLAAILKDVADWDRDLEPFLVLDYQRIERIVVSRGMSFVTIDMPEAAKVLDQALSRGRFWPEQFPETFGAIRNGHRKLFRCLMTKVFDDGGILRENAEIKAIFFLRQLLLIAKKVEGDCGETAIKAEVEAFRQIDQSLYTPNLNWVGDRLAEGRVARLDFGDNLRLEPDLFSNRDWVRSKQLAMVGKVADILVGMFPELDWRQVIPRHGPGAVADAKTGTDKYLFPTWPAKLERVFPANYFSQSREDLTSTEAEVIGHFKEPPARLMAVPKTMKGPRMIASEPVSHQFIQLGLMAWMRDNLPRPLRNSIDFHDQNPSRVMCVVASETGKLATVDLSAASDRLSCWVVERFFRVNHSILEALHAARTRWLYNASGVGEPYFVILKKFAPMGNGTTFPIQSIVYAAIAMASVLYEENMEATSANIHSVSRRIRTYGDDIILPSSAVPTLVAILEYFQLKVNQRKSFAEGHFRESCGMDAFKGVDVTPVKLKSLSLKDDSADSLASWCDVSKNAARKGLGNLSCWLEDRIPENVRELLPRTQGAIGCISLWSPFLGVEGGKRRYNRKLYRHEVLALTSRPKVEKRKRESFRDLLQYFLERPAPDSKWVAGYVVRKRTQMRVRWVPIH